jgi:hypothetical protein
MCYSANISLLTFVSGFSFSILLTQINNNFYKLLGYFLGFVSLMQLVEYLLWKHQICDNYHKQVSLIGMILNHLQPVVLGLLTYIFYEKNPIALGLLIITYLAVIIPYSLQFTSNLQCTTKPCTTDPHLVWQWNNMKYSKVAYSIFLATFIGIGLFGMPFNKGLLFSITAFSTYMLSSVIYDRKVIGSLWCFWTAFMPFIIYINYKLKIF